MKQAGARLLLKKAADRLFGAAVLVATAPVVAVAALSVRLTMGGPVFFSQVRPGHRGRLFRIYKLRSMTDERGSDGELLADDARLTRLGAFLRTTSIDELPQLWNVVRGELSLVGPRPLLVEYLELYSPEQARRHDVLPGITGWSQINGRNARSWEEKLALDVWYVDHWSLGLDLGILASTVVAVATARGVAAEGQATTTKFRGAAPAATVSSTRADQNG